MDASLAPLPEFPKFMRALDTASATWAGFFIVVAALSKYIILYPPFQSAAKPFYGLTAVNGKFDKYAIILLTSSNTEFPQNLPTQALFSGENL